MCKRFVYLVSFVLVLGVTVSADAGTNVFQEVDGMVVMEGENFQAADGRTDENNYEWRISDTQAGFVGTGYVDTPGPKGDNGDWANACEVTYEINFSTPGQYYVWVRRYALSNASNSCYVGLDGEQDTREQTNSDYNQWIWYLADDPIEVTAGRHTFNLRRRESQYAADRILLTTDNAFTPTGDGPPESSFDSPGEASDPFPADEATDVARDLTLSWTPGEFTPPVNGHKVYFSESFDDVNDGVDGITQGANSYTLPQRLVFDTIYYWRVDEVNNVNSGSPWIGNVWSFTTEQFSYPIPAENIIVTASSYEEGRSPENTVNGSGLVDNLHSTELEDMWLTAIGEPAPAWIQYDFDKAYKLHEMFVWNYNGESFLTAAGLKDVIVEYLSDGTNWMQIDSVNEFARASGLDDYAPNPTVAFEGIPVKSVKITANSNWSGGLADQFGLSEVQFMQIPTHVRQPIPEDGATDVAVDVILGWREGREASSHDVFISDNPNALMLADSVDQPSFNTASQALALGSSYHWRIDEVNDAETPETWQGDVWSFRTADFLVVDDFEDYDVGNKEIWWVWKDGLGYAAHDNEPAYTGNGTGSAVGNETSDSYTEEIIVHGDKQSMPLFYDNSSLSYSEATVNTDNLAIGRDWTKGAAETLVLWFHGDPANATTERMYIKLNGTEVEYPGDSADIARPWWMQWNIDLADFGITLNNVTEMSIGFKRTGTSGGTGTVFIDDIRLYRVAPEPPNEWRVSASNDDAEEHGDWDAGAMEDLTSTDMEMPYEDTGMGEIQIIGLRFTGIPIPRSATITEAWVQFQVDDPKDGTLPVNLTINGELSANSATFSDVVHDISGRPTTTAQVQWSVPNWVTVGDHGPDQTTPSIASIIQEIVNQPGWSGGAIVLMFRDDPASPSQGIRSAVSFDGDPLAAPLLHISYE